MCVARTISVVMEQGNITYTIVHGLSEIIAYFPQVFTIVGIFLAVMLIDFFIPAGSGEAVVVMPIISPLAEILGLSSRRACSHSSLAMAGRTPSGRRPLRIWPRWLWVRSSGRIGNAFSCRCSASGSW